MYTLKTSNKFEKDFIKCLKRNYNPDDITIVLDLLEKSGQLPRKFKPHLLSGNYFGYWGGACQNLR